MPAAHAIVADYCVVIVFVLLKRTVFRLNEEPLQLNVLM